MNIETAVNIAVSCIMASPLELDEKREVIGKLRTIKNSLEEINDILDGQNVTPLVESIGYVLVQSGIYEKD